VKEEITMEDLLYRCQHVIRREVEVIHHQVSRNGITLIGGEASFVDPYNLIVKGQEGTTEIGADYLVIATGTVPSQPEEVDVDQETVITSDMVMGIQRIPQTLTVVGAGVIGTEYASIFAALGVEVTLVDKEQQLLEFVDVEIMESLKYQMRDLDCIFRLGEEVASVTVEEPRRAVATLRSGKRIVSELLLYSIGRIGATAALNLKAAGLTADQRGRLKVNERYQTEQPHIFAAGDVIGFPALASTSMEQGRIAACNAFLAPVISTPELFPYGIYTVPEISMVGKSERELTEEGIPYEVGLSRYREIARGVILGDDSGLLKLLFHRETRTILGVHIIGTAATELIHIGQAVIAMGGTIDYFVNTVFNYPTFAECYKVAALDGYNKVGPTEGGVPPPGSGLQG
jgi:NAD(P) transhydrogenase